MINPMQLMQAMRNPQAFMNQIMGNQQMMNNPMIQNTVNMAQKGDMKGIEQMARNLCKEKGLNADEIFNQFKSKMNM
jgi:hypothetical protein